ncbi:MAG TPA: hypothetical protein VES67_10050 [Vicinamibacterales bacterium]|nr:hypothetical protein [Vicinamibacterales bacterium]
MSLHRRIFVSSLALAALVALSSNLGAQSASPLNGTWKLNVAKSKYNPATLAPKSGTTKIEITGDTIKAVIDGVDPEGRVTHQEYTARFDGKDHPWKGTIDGKPNPNQDAVTWRKIDDYTYETTNKLKGQTLTTNRIVVATDGKTRTNTVTGKNAQGQTVNNTVLYEKQ